MYGTFVGYGVWFWFFVGRVKNDVYSSLFIYSGSVARFLKNETKLLACICYVINTVASIKHVTIIFSHLQEKMNQY